MRIVVSALVVLSLLVGCQRPVDRPNVPSGAGNKSAAGNVKPDSGTAMRNRETTVGSIRLTPRKLLQGKFEILIPDGFTEMSEEMLRVKYPSDNRPTLVFTNAAGTVNVAINHTSNRVAPEQLRQLHSQLDTSIRQAQPQAQWMFSGFQHYHGREWTQLEFNSVAADTKIHNMMLATSADGRMLAVSFNTTDALAAEWLPVGREIIKSCYFE